MKKQVRMTRRLIGILVALALVLALLPAAAVAADTPDSGVTAEGTQGTDDGAPLPSPAEPPATSKSDRLPDGLTPPAEETKPIVVAAFDAIDPATYEIAVGEELPALPGSLGATDADGQPLAIGGVTWECDNFDASAPGEYVFTARLPEGYELAADAELPQLTVKVGEAVRAMAAQRAETGPFIITGVGLTGDDYTYDSGNDVLTIKSGTPMVISNLTPTMPTNVRIVVQNGVMASLALGNVNIETDKGPALDMAGATVSLTLGGDNFLKTTERNSAGLHAPEGADLTIGGTGSLTATGTGGAGIGGDGIGHGDGGTDPGTLKSSLGRELDRDPVVLTLDDAGMAGKAVTWLQVGDYVGVDETTGFKEHEYGIHDMKTDGDGKVYLYLPEDAVQADTKASLRPGGTTLYSGAFDQAPPDARKATLKAEELNGNIDLFTLGAGQNLYIWDDHYGAGADATEAESNSQHHKGDYTLSGGTADDPIQNTVIVMADYQGLNAKGETLKTIVLDGLNIDVRAEGKCAFSIEKGAGVSLALADNSLSTLKSGEDNAGLQVPGGAVLTIGGGGSNTTGGVGDNIRITGGSVTAKSTGGAGIGGGGGNTEGGAGGAINIEGGSITATGNSGAGIGGGYGGSGGSVTINGGTVSANGLSRGAGIGGGYGGSGGSVTINGGTVSANGSGGSSGIGGGWKGSGGTVGISGASTRVTAKSDSGYDVGGGKGGSLKVSDGATLIMQKNGTNAPMTDSIGACVIEDSSASAFDASWAGNLDGTYSPLTVTGGTASYTDAQKAYWQTGIVRNGVAVTATANTPPANRFTGWTESGVSLANPKETSVSFPMPENAVTLAAGFEPIPGPSVSPTSLAIQEGKTATFTVSLGESGNEADSAAVRSGDTNIATVSPATVTTSPMAVTVTGLRPGTTDITVEFVGGTYGGGSKTVSVTVTAEEGKVISAPDENTPLDLGKDAVFAFSGNYANLSAVRLDGHVLTQTATSETQADLSGYPGYSKVLGDVKSGSVIVTLYKDFLNTLPNGRHTLTVEFLGGSAVGAGEAQFTIEKPEPTPTPTPTPAPSAQPTPAPTAEGTQGTSPKTGDSADMALWIVLVCVAGASITGVWLYKRRKHAR